MHEILGYLLSKVGVKGDEQKSNLTLLDTIFISFIIIKTLWFISIWYIILRFKGYSVEFFSQLVVKFGFFQNNKTASLRSSEFICTYFSRHIIHSHKLDRLLFLLNFTTDNFFITFLVGITNPIILAWENKCQKSSILLSLKIINQQKDFSLSYTNCFFFTICDKSSSSRIPTPPTRSFTKNRDSHLNHVKSVDRASELR